MRRAAPDLPISPKLLKQFAVVTLALTAVLAVFANEQEWGAKAQIKTITDRNQLLKTEAEKFGPRALVNNFKIANSAGKASSWGDDQPASPPETVISYDRTSDHSSAPLPLRLSSEGPFVPDLPQKPGASITVTGMDAEDLPNADPKKKKRKTGEQYRPISPEELEALKAASRLRSGAPYNEGE